MKTKGIPLDTLIKEWQKKPDFQKAYDALEAEFAVYDAMLKAMKKSGMTQTELAERMQITKSTLSRTLNAKHSPSWNTISRFAEALGMRPVLSFVKA